MNMAEKFCFQCNKKLGRFLNFGLTDMKKLSSPKGMTNDDKICDKCFSNLPKNKDYEKQKALEKEEKEKRKAEEKKLNEEKKILKEILEKEEKEKRKAEEKKLNEEKKILKEIQQKENVKRFDEIRTRFHKHETIMYQDEYCAIVKKITDLSFIKAFSDLTREGYRLMAQDEGGQFHLGIASVGIDSYYFFQKIEYVTPKK